MANVVFKDNPDYKQVFLSQVHGVPFYMPSDSATANGYHLSRYVAAGEQNIYSASGATKDYLDAITQQMLDIVNKQTADRVKSDIAVLVNNIRYRLKHPVDNECALRMGAIYTFMDGEDPNECKGLWIDKKVKMALEDADLYTFFLHMGVTFTPAWSEQLTLLETMTEYLSKREADLRTLQLV